MANTWIILLGTFTVMFLEIGTLKSLSLFFESITKEFDMSSGQLGICIGLSHGLTVSCGILANALLRKISPRCLVMFGGLIGSTLLMACFLVKADIQLAFCLAISGCGYGLVVLPSHVSVISAFGDNYSLALSISMMGSGVGMMLLPLATQVLLASYGWRGAILILGAINLHTTLAGALFVPTVISRESSVSQANEETLSLITLTCSHNQNESEESRKLSRLCSALQQRCFQSLSQNVASLNKSVGLNIFAKYPLLIYFVFASLVQGVTYNGWTVFVIPNALDKGFAERRAVTLAIAVGIGNTIGRGIPAIVSRLSCKMLSSRTLFIIFGIINALPLCLNASVKTFPLLMVFAAVNGMAIGTKTVLKTMVFVDFVPASFMSSAVSFAMVGQGAGELFGGWITGYIYDHTQSFDSAFLALGCTDLIGAIALILSFVHEKIIELKYN